jgi:hypothetical protein
MLHKTVDSNTSNTTVHSVTVHSVWAHPEHTRAVCRTVQVS